MSRKKVTVVGGGFVGSTTAQRIVDLELADVVLTDILDGPPAGKALDMIESGPITRTDAHALGISTATGDYSATAGSDEAATSKRSSTAVDTLLTFCPPGPDARTKRSSMSRSSI